MIDFWSDDGSTTVRLWSLADDALVEDGPEPGEFTVVTQWAELRVRNEDPVVADALRRMTFGPVALRNSFGGIGRSPEGTEREVQSVLALEQLLDRIGGAVVHSLALPDGQGPLLSVEPVTSDARFRLAPLPPAATLRLSWFAGLRPVHGCFVLETPGSAFRVDLCQPLAHAVVMALVVPAGADAVADKVGAPRALVAEILAFLLAAGSVLLADERGAFAEDTDQRLGGWAQYELQFHQQSRSSSVRREVTEAVLPPVTRPETDGRRYALYRPDLAVLTATDPTLTTLLEADHLCPTLTGGPLAAAQLGELLFRSARVRSTGPSHIPTANGGTDHDASQRPYSTIACLYELEIYVTVGNCVGLPRGMYHYDPVDHALVLLELPDAEDRVAAMLEIGRVAAGSIRAPAVQLTVAARTARVSWVLPGAAYAIALMHAGALQETLYLNGRILGLWAHGVPANAPDAERLLGLSWPAEVAVSECVVDPLVPALDAAAADPRFRPADRGSL